MRHGTFGSVPADGWVAASLVLFFSETAVNGPSVQVSSQHTIQAKPRNDSDTIAARQPHWTVMNARTGATRIFAADHPGHECAGQAALGRRVPREAAV